MTSPIPQLIELDRAPEFGDRFLDALQYAARVHAAQRKESDDQPYIAHLLRVTGFVMEDGGSENEAIAALLHDAPEDQGGQARLAEIRQRFGEAVAKLVNECTDSFLESKPPWRQRKERYVSDLGDSSSGALRVSLADKLDNVRTLLRDYHIQGEALWSRAGRRREDVLWYYGALAKRFTELRPGPLADELARAVGELDRLVAEHRVAAPRRAGLVG
jgi:(p)ppGpp synthase/HD superfamily hydrolase